MVIVTGVKSLSSYVSNQGLSLSDVQIEALMDLLGRRCQEKTKRRLRSTLKYGMHSISNYGIFGRVNITETGASYCAGQSYPDEIRTVRKLILKG